jgi:hypothetical protein
MPDKHQYCLPGAIVTRIWFLQRVEKESLLIRSKGSVMLKLPLNAVEFFILQRRFKKQKKAPC